MKYFFYTVFFLASLGTIGAVLNPPLAKKWAALAGIDLSGADSSSEQVSADDQIKKFMDQYAIDHTDHPSRLAGHHPETEHPATMRPETEHPETRHSATMHGDSSRRVPDFPPVAPPTSIPGPSLYAAAPPSAPEPASAPPAPPIASSWNHDYSAPPADSFSSEAVSPLTTPPLTTPPLTTVPAINLPPQPYTQQPDTPQPSVYAAAMAKTHQPPEGTPPQTQQQTPPEPAFAAVPASTPAPDMSDPFIASHPPVSPAGFAPVNEQPFAATSAVSPNSPPDYPPNLPPNTMLNTMSNTIPNTVPNLPPSSVSSSVQTPAVLIEDVHCPGTETVARVGTQVILMCDILPKIRRTAIRMVNENLKRMPPEERAKIPPEEIDQAMNAFIESGYPQFLQEQILLALIYNDYVLSKMKAERDHFDSRIGAEFDRNEVPAMMKEFGVNDQLSFKNYLKEKLGSSLERERMLWVRERIAQQWIAAAAQKATSDCTCDEMMEFYEKNLEMFTAKAKARWQELMVQTARYKTEEEAMKKICWMGNQVQSGAPFEEIAKVNSDGFTASGGGVVDWTAKGSFVSPELEQAVFSQPVGSLSPAVIKTDKGLHIIKVLEREDAKITPFTDAQVVIRNKIQNQRGQRYQDEYIAELRRRFPAEILKDKLDLKGNAGYSSAQKPHAVQR